MAAASSLVDEMHPTSSSTTAPEYPPPATVDHVMHCSFSSWYPIFSSVTLQSRIIPVSEDFIEYLNADGIFLPLDGNGLPQHGFSSDEEEESASSDERTSLDEESDKWRNEMLARFRPAGDESDSDGNDDETVEPSVPSFPQLQAEIESAIQAFGGAVFPKMNWSSPKDAAWIATGSTLKCNSASDVFLLLKGSDFIAHDLSHAFEECELQESSVPTRPPHFELVLRKWYDLRPSMEFRCFVKDHALVAITQRDTSNYYDFLPPMKEELKQKIVEFYENKVKNQFPDKDYVFDVYISQKGQRKVWLIDINPFSRVTDTLLFDWQEILQFTNESPEFRVINGHWELSNVAQPAFSSNRLPREVIDVSNGASIEQFTQNFNNLLLESATTAR
ncbi:hypothetical protein HDU85_000759 [Gaertneriomyces sp. JEL0708]|nr:hypothetical protein HDU85_000759 [Gaertneriomyces sp. JEL0708]